MKKASDPEVIFHLSQLLCQPFNWDTNAWMSRRDVRILVHEAACAKFVEIDDPCPDRRVTVDIFKWDALKAGDIGTSVYVSLLSLLTQTMLKATRFQDLAVEASTTLGEPRDGTMPPIEQDVYAAFKEHKVGEHLANFLSGPSTTAQRLKESERRGRIFKLLANVSFSLFPLSERVALADLCVRQVLLSLMEAPAESAHANSDELASAAKVLSNLTYRDPKQQAAITAYYAEFVAPPGPDPERATLRDLLKTQILEHQVDFQSDGVAKNNTALTVLALMTAYLNCQYNISQDKRPKRGQVVEVLRHAAKAVAENANHLVQLGYLAGCLLRITGDEDESYEIVDACAAALKPIARLVKFKHEPAADDALEQPLWPMSHYSFAADAVAARFFVNLGQISAALHNWTTQYWLGVGPNELTERLLTRSLEKQASTFASFTAEMGSDSARQVEPTARLDRLCQAGLSPMEAEEVLRTDIVTLEHEGALSYIVSRYKDTILTHQGRGAPHGVGVMLWQSFDKWQYQQPEKPTAEEVERWLADYVGAALEFRHLGVRNCSLQRACEDAAYNGSAIYQMSTKKRVVPVKIVQFSDTDEQAEDLVTMAHLLQDAQVGPPKPGYKRWFHGCIGKRALGILHNASLANHLTRAPHDYTRRKAYYLHEFAALAASHSRGKPRASAEPAPTGYPAVMIFDLQTDRLRRRTPNYVPVSAAEAKLDIFCSRNDQPSNGMPTAAEATTEELTLDAVIAMLSPPAPAAPADDDPPSTDDDNTDDEDGGERPAEDEGPSRSDLQQQLTQLMEVRANQLGRNKWLFGPMFRSKQNNPSTMTFHALDDVEFAGNEADKADEATAGGEDADDEDCEDGLITRMGLKLRQDACWSMQYFAAIGAIGELVLPDEQSTLEMTIRGLRTVVFFKPPVTDGTTCGWVPA